MIKYSPFALPVKHFFLNFSEACTLVALSELWQGYSNGLESTIWGNLFFPIAAGMNLSRNEAELFVPDGLDPASACSRTTHLGIGAHADDLEFMAPGGILQCFMREDRWFGGVTCTDGAGSVRSGPYVGFPDERLKGVRVQEQRAAAAIGRYGMVIQLAHPSSVAKAASLRSPLVDDLEKILRGTQPEVVYTHNPFDRHPTHLGVLSGVLEALRRIPEDLRPQRLLGCEVWRGLDWLPDVFKVVETLDHHPNLISALNGVFVSQITGGKRYDLAVEGRHLANATFSDSHAADSAERVALGIDLSELIGQEQGCLGDFCDKVFSTFRNQIAAAIGEVL